MEWRLVPGFEGVLMVSRQGDVRNLVNMKMVRARHPRENDYLRYAFTQGGKVLSFAIHRLVAMAFCEGWKSGLIVNHINGIKWDNRAENLEWVTHSENSKKALALGTWQGCHVSTPFWREYLPKVLATIPALEEVS